MPPYLAAVVPKPDVDAALDAFRGEGVYDGSRRIRPGGDDAIEIPVTRRPTSITVTAVVEQADPEWRTATLIDRLRADGWADEDLERVPTSWAVIGTVVLVRLSDCPRPEAVAGALLDIHGQADTVLDYDGVDGHLREPSVRVVGGVGETETIHREHGTKYALDLSSVMFSPGNQAERVRMGAVVEPGERVFDMFAGIGYFTLPMARSGATVTAAEINPTAFRYLVENAMLNDVADRVDAFLADCRTVETTADRVVMGYYDAPDYLDAAISALVRGGTVHLHAAVPERELWEKPIGRLRAACDPAGRSATVLDRRTVKSHSPGIQHVVVDARID